MLAKGEATKLKAEQASHLGTYPHMHFLNAYAYIWFIFFLIPFHIILQTSEEYNRLSCIKIS